MTTAVEQGGIRTTTDRRDRLARAWDPGRLWVRLGRMLWMHDRAMVELRWAGITLSALAALALLAKLIDPTDHRFDAAILLDVPAAAIALALGWAAAGERLAHQPWFRMALGPGVVILALIGAGIGDLDTLAMPSAAPLIVLALAYSAMTPGYPLAASMVAGLAVGIAVAHASVVAAVRPRDLVSDEFVIRVAVLLLTATGFAIVVRVATDAEERAQRLASRSRRRVDDLEAVERIARRFDGRRPVRDVIQSVVDDVSRSFDIALVSMYLPDGDGRLSMVGVAGYHSPFHVIDMGVGVIGRAAVSQETQFIPDVLADPDYRAARDDVRNEIAAPIVHDGELMGVVNFEGTLAHPLGTGHVALAEMLARTIAATLRSARLDEERRARLYAIERVLDVSRGLVSDLDRRRTIDAVVDAAVDLLAAETVIVAGRGSDGWFRVEGDSADPRDGSWHARVLGPEDAVALEAIESAAPVVRHAGTDADAADRPTMALPIRIDDTVAAVLVATRRAAAPPFGAMECSVGDLLATQVGVALHNADRHATVSDAAVRDPLTGLLNRRYFDEAVETAFADARRSSQPLSLIVLDLDRFSAVNNDHGHPVGDAVLRRVAVAMSGAVRAGDTVARYGGEEFVIIAPGAATDEAVAIAERVRSAVGGADGGVSTGPGAGIAVTVSAGVASLLGDELDGQALVRAADSALLAAKRAGRDRVVAV